MISQAKQFLFRTFGGQYDAIDSRQKRRPPTRAGKSEDNVLTDSKRRLLSGTTQEVQRNFAIAAWVIRQHLNYVSAFTFQCRTGNNDFDNGIERFMADWSKRDKCDIRRRHPLRRLFRLTEAMRVVHGDVFLIKLAGKGIRGKLQPIEGDRVRTPEGKLIKTRGENNSDWVNGVKIDKNGAASGYAIHNRSDSLSTYELDRVVKADSLFAHGYYERFDQVRGVSPIASALNSLQDVYEGFDYTLAKVKVSQLFGLAIYRDATEGIDDAYATLDTDADDIPDSDYKVDFSGGPQLLDLAPGDRAEFLESKSPPAETINFLKLVIQVAIKALDIPYSFFDESHTNFYGSRAGLIQYLHSCKPKIEDNAELLMDITRWRLNMAIMDGAIELPLGLTIDDLMRSCEWVPNGVPWWDPVKEVKGHSMAIEKGLDNPQRVCRSNGTDYFENVDRIAEALEYAKSKGVPIQFATIEGDPDEEESDDTRPEPVGSANQDSTPTGVDVVDGL